jgi:hypothetical protein
VKLLATLLLSLLIQMMGHEKFEVRDFASTWGLRATIVFNEPGPVRKAARGDADPEVRRRCSLIASYYDGFWWPPLDGLDMSNVPYSGHQESWDAAWEVPEDFAPRIQVYFRSLEQHGVPRWQLWKMAFEAHEQRLWQAYPSVRTNVEWWVYWRMVKVWAVMGWGVPAWPWPYHYEYEGYPG